MGQKRREKVMRRRGSAVEKLGHCAAPKLIHPVVVEGECNVAGGAIERLRAAA